MVSNDLPRKIKAKILTLSYGHWMGNHRIRHTKLNDHMAIILSSKMI